MKRLLIALGLVGSPLKPVTGIQISTRLGYAMLLLVSIWATSESFHTSFSNIPRLICYVVGILPALLIAVTLNWAIKNFHNRSVFGLMVSSLALLVFLTFSVWTNAHKFFIEMKLDDIRKFELETASNELTLIRKNSNSIAEGIIEDYQTLVAGHIRNYKEEVENVENCGHGPEAQKLLGKVHESMPGSQFKLLSGYPKTASSCRQLANEMSRIMTAELNNRVEDMEQNTLNMELLCDEEGLVDGIIENLDLITNEYYLTHPLEVKKILSRAHQHYEMLYDCIEKRLLTRINTVGSKNLDFPKNLQMPVASIVLEKFPQLPYYVNSHRRHMSSFVISVFIALILDVGAIILLVSLLSKNDDRNY